MAHTIRDKEKLIARVRRIKGQIEGIERALAAEGIDGERFIASGPFMMMKDVAAVLRTQLGREARNVPTRGLPDILLQLTSLFDPTVRMVTG
ncbi:MAG: hypothetical protein B7Y74_16475, partial [Novosphingobium sp. 35-62-5]